MILPKFNKFFILFLTTFFFMSYFGHASAAGIFQFQGNAQHTGLSKYTGPSSGGFVEKWVLPIEVGEADPTTTDDGTIYITSKAGVLYALNADRSEKWSLNIGTTSRGAPAISSNGNIHVAGEDGYLYAVSPSGALLWTFKTKTGQLFSSGSILGSPAIGDDDTIYVAGIYGDLNAIDSNGNLLWTADVSRYNNGYEYLWNSTPTIGKNGNIYIQSSDPLNYNKGYLFAFNMQTGAIMWAMPIGDGYFSTPTVGDNGTIYAGGRWKDTVTGTAIAKYYAFQDNGASYTIQWSIPLYEWLSSSTYGSAAIAPDGEAVYFIGIPPDVNSYYLFKVNAATGAEIWRHKLTNYYSYISTLSTPLVGSDGTIYLGADKSLQAISADGIALWNYDTGAVIWNSPTLGPDGTLYIGSDELHALEAAP